MRTLTHAHTLTSVATAVRRVVAGLLLDGLNAAAAYSPRLLRTEYTGPAIRVRRSNDNAEQDIGFTLVGDLDTVALLAFVGANSAFVSVWYDQSGNDRHATQTTLGNQPQIVTSGVVEVDGGRVCLKQSTGQFMTFPVSASIDYTVNYVARVISSGARVLSGSPNWLLGFHAGLYTRAYFGAAFCVLQNTGANGSSKIIHSATVSGNLATGVFRNGESLTIISTSNAGFTSLNSNGRYGSSSEGSNSIFQELIVFHSAIPTSVLKNVERSQGAYYGITVA